MSPEILSKLRRTSSFNQNGIFPFQNSETKIVFYFQSTARLLFKSCLISSGVSQQNPSVTCCLCSETRLQLQVSTAFCYRQIIFRRLTSKPFKSSSKKLYLVYHSQVIAFVGQTEIKLYYPLNMSRTRGFLFPFLPPRFFLLNAHTSFFNCLSFR